MKEKKSLDAVDWMQREAMSWYIGEKSGYNKVIVRIKGKTCLDILEKFKGGNVWIQNKYFRNLMI